MLTPSHELPTFGVLGTEVPQGYAPENTLAAVEMGLSFGVDYIEIDLQCTGRWTPRGHA